MDFDFKKQDFSASDNGAQESFYDTSIKLFEQAQTPAPPNPNRTGYDGNGFPELLPGSEMFGQRRVSPPELPANTQDDLAEIPAEISAEIPAEIPPTPELVLSADPAEIAKLGANKEHLADISLKSFSAYDLDHDQDLDLNELTTAANDTDSDMEKRAAAAAIAQNFDLVKALATDAKFAKLITSAATEKYKSVFTDQASDGISLNDALALKSLTTESGQSDFVWGVRSNEIIGGSLTCVSGGIQLGLGAAGVWASSKTGSLFGVAASGMLASSGITTGVRGYNEITNSGISQLNDRFAYKRQKLEAWK
ncbi:MAG: hypothetical protein IAF58_10650 [Leptolyngbya sp.]|nr:hypothetical protein [Candidatus Melainabacteria bacterium]